jgi:hypothetical protein
MVSQSFENFRGISVILQRRVVHNNDERLCEPCKGVCLSYHTALFADITKLLHLAERATCT